MSFQQQPSAAGTSWAAATATVTRKLQRVVRLHALLLVAACGGSGGYDAAPSNAPANPSPPAPPPPAVTPPPNTAPSVDAGTDQSASPGSVIVLDGSAADAEGDPLHYAWTQTGGPAVTLTPAGRTATFTSPNPDSDVVLEFVLTVTDPGGAAASDGISVTIVANVPPPPDSPPAADAGDDHAVSERTEVVLDGSGSNDADGELVAYRWEQISGAPVALDDAASTRPRFLAPGTNDPQTLEFRLTVTDDAGGAAEDTIRIEVVAGQDVPADPDRFLQFLNATADRYVGSEASANAYYAAIDPNNEKTTLDAWLAANGFADGADARAVYRNAADLGFGRVMALRQNVDGSVAAYVENYPTLESAVDAVRTGIRDELLATVAMEYAAGPGGGPRFTKFYTFAGDDQRINAIDLDGRGAKYMPGLCNFCHGGEPKPLVNGVFPDGGDTGAQFLPWDLDTLEFSDDPLYTRAAQEDELKVLNTGALATHPETTAAGVWSGGVARELIEGWYGGPGMPSATFDGSFVPLGWRAAADGGPTGNPHDSAELYLTAIAPNCRACHLQRGHYFADHPEGESIDFGSYAGFMAYAAETIDLIYDEGKMPAALVTFDRFWSNRDAIVAAERLALHLRENAIERRPGPPVADPGPDRRAAVGNIPLSGTASRFAATFSWSFAANGRPGNSAATIDGANTATPTLVADVPGAYRLQLVVSDGQQQSAPATVTILASLALAPARFSTDVAPVLAQHCMRCHSAGGPESVAGIPARFDEPATRYEAVLAYVDRADITRSPILTKPAGAPHGGDTVPGFSLSGLPGADRSGYDAILRWIAEGAANN